MNLFHLTCVHDLFSVSALEWSNTHTLAVDTPPPPVSISLSHTHTKAHAHTHRQIKQRHTMMSITFIFLSCSQFLLPKRFLGSWIRPYVKNNHQSSLTVSFDSKTRLFFDEMFRKFSTVKTISPHQSTAIFPFNHCTCTFNERVPCPKLLVIGQRNTNTKHHTEKQKPDISTEKRKASYKKERMVEPVFSFAWSWVKLGKKTTTKRR